MQASPTLIGLLTEGCGPQRNKVEAIRLFIVGGAIAKVAKINGHGKLHVGLD
jgi:hypothetical protein